MTLVSSFRKINFPRDLHAEFTMGYEGIKMLPKDARFGVFVAYVFYYKLFKKIRNEFTEDILSSGVRISYKRKFALFFSSYIRHSFNIL